MAAAKQGRGQEGIGFSRASGLVPFAGPMCLLACQTKDTGRCAVRDSRRQMKRYSRCFPSLVVHFVLVDALPVPRVLQLVVEHFRFVQQFMVEAQDLLSLLVIRRICRGRRHRSNYDRTAKEPPKKAPPKNPVYLGGVDQATKRKETVKEDEGADRTEEGAFTSSPALGPPRQTRPDLTFSESSTHDT
jgi:hypothetical protein